MTSHLTLFSVATLAVVPKFCSACQRFKDRGEFNRFGRAPDGLHARCRACSNRSSSEWVEVNRERHNANNQAWRDANRERDRTASRARYQRDLIRSREISRRNELNRRARKRDAFDEFVDPVVVLERDDGVCGICGGDVDPLDFHVDHVVPLARGGRHNYANVQVAHGACNMRKGCSS